MSAFSFTAENIIAINKLEMSVRKTSGVRYSLSEERSLLDLIKHASVSKSVQVEAAFLAFVQSLSPDQRHQLVYRGVSFSPSSAKAELPSTQRSLYKERTYRGVTEVVPVAEPPKGDTQKKKPKRIYRGRLIED